MFKALVSLSKPASKPFLYRAFSSTCIPFFPSNPSPKKPALNTKTSSTNKETKLVSLPWTDPRLLTLSVMLLSTNWTTFWLSSIRITQLVLLFLLEAKKPLLLALILRKWRTELILIHIPLKCWAIGITLPLSSISESNEYVE